MPLLNTIPSILAILLLFFASTVHAGIGITFVTPAAGSTWPAGPFTVSWQDSGGTPGMSDLVDCTVSLIIGGNSDTNSQVIETIGVPHTPVSAGKIEAEIPANVSQSQQNGFYLKMVANTTSGSTVINYSPRFTLIRLNGTTDEVYLAAAQAASGATDVPSSYSIVAPPTTSTLPSATSTALPSASSSPSDGTDGSSDSRAENVGLIIGGIFALIGAASIVIWIVLFIRRRRKRRASRLAAKEASADRRTQILLDYKAELSGESVARRSKIVTGELSPDSERFEMEGRDQAIEMQAQRSTIYHELEGSGPELEAGGQRRSRLGVDKTEEGGGESRWSWRASLVDGLSGDHRRSRDVQPPPPPT
jgi:hypothetical protein